MSEDFDQLVDNLKEPAAWIRILLMVGYAILLYFVVVPVVVVLMLAQALFVVFSGESNQNLKYLGAMLAEYVLQILHFLFYNSETRPFPFSDFPAWADDDEESAQNVGSAAPAKSRKASAAKKKPSRAHSVKSSASSKSPSNNTGNKTGKAAGKSGSAVPQEDDESKD